MFIVTRGFIDLQDNNHEYSSGDAYPREGATPTPERIAELASDKNLQGAPLIKAVKGAKKKSSK